MGGHLNAYTSREQTAYYAKVFRKDVPKAVDILADLLQNSVLEPSAIERERGVILREAEEVSKQMDEVVFDHLHSVAFQGSPLGQTILGPEENIKALGREELLSYIKSNYTANRMVLAAAGAVDHEALVKLAESAFSGLPKGRSAGWQPLPAAYTGAEVRMTDESMPHAHMAIAVQGASWVSEDYLPLLVAQAIVGSWNRGLASGANGASRLAQVVAQNGLAQSFLSFNTSYMDTGLFGIYMVSDKTSDLDDLVYEVQQEWVRLCLNVTEAEVARARTQLQAALLLSLDGSTPVAEDIGRQLLIYGRRHSPTELLQRIAAIDAKTVRRVASNYLYDRCPAVVALGPIGTFPDYNRIRAATLWLRN